MFYSASKNTWLIPQLRPMYEKNGNWPDDAKEYKKEVYDAVVSNRPADKVMAADENGHPILTDPPAQSTTAIWGDIKSERDRRKSGGLKVSIEGVSKWFHSDVDSRIQHLGLKDKARDLIAAGGQVTDSLMILAQPVQWKTMDGSFVVITAQMAFDIVDAAGNLDAQLFAVAENHRISMEASSDPESYDYSGMWPEKYVSDPVG